MLDATAHIDCGARVRALENRYSRNLGAGILESETLNQHPK